MGALDHDMRTSTVSTDRTWRRGIITFRGNGAGTAHVRDCPKKDSLVWTGVSERSSALAGSGGDDAGAQQKKQQPEMHQMASGGPHNKSADGPREKDGH